MRRARSSPAGTEEDRGRKDLRNITKEILNIWNLIRNRRQKTREQLAYLIKKAEECHTTGNEKRKWGSEISIDCFCALGFGGIAILLSGGTATPVAVASVRVAAAAGAAAVGGGTLKVTWANDLECEETKSVINEVNDAVKSENAAAKLLKGKMEEFQKVFRMLENKWERLGEIWSDVVCLDIKSILDMKEKVHSKY